MSVGLRNRIADHEPIHQLDLSYQQNTLFLVGRIEPGLTAWLKDASRLADVPGRRSA